MEEIGIEEIARMIKADIAAPLVFEEERYHTTLLRQYLTEEYLVRMDLEDKFREPACTGVIRIMDERLKDRRGPLVVDEDVALLHSAFRDSVKIAWPNSANNQGLVNLLGDVASRYMSIFVNYCALVHQSQRVAVTAITAATMMTAAENTVEMRDVIYDDALRGQVIRRLVAREDWMEASLERPLRETGWKDLDDSVKAGLRATFERRAREIWGR